MCSSSISPGTPRPRPAPTALYGTHKSRHGTQDPRFPPTASTPLFRRPGRTQSEYRVSAFPQFLASESPPPSQTTENRFPTTSGSTACTGWLPAPPQTARPSAHRFPAHPDSSSPASTLPRSAACQSQTASPEHLICPLASSQHRWLIKQPGSSRTHVRLPERTSRQPIPFALRAALPPSVAGRHACDYYEMVRLPVPRPVLNPSQICCLGLSLPAGQPTPACLFRDEDLPRSALVPGPGSRHLSAGDRLASKQVTARLIPGQQLDPGSDPIATLSTRHQWFPYSRLPDPHLTPDWRLFCDRSLPRVLNAAAHSGLKPPPAGRL